MFDIFKNKEEFIGSFSNEEKNQQDANQVKDKVHLKQLLTILSKKKLESILPIRKQMIVCEKSCYSNVDIKNISDDTADELRECKQKCKVPYQDLLHFLDNINFLSENKMKMCTKGCKKKMLDQSVGDNSKKSEEEVETYDECMWVCYNKLDRRYKEYWKNQKEDIVKRHYFKSYQELTAQFQKQ